MVAKELQSLRQMTVDEPGAWSNVYLPMCAAADTGFISYLVAEMSDGWAFRNIPVDIEVTSDDEIFFVSV